MSTMIFMTPEEAAVYMRGLYSVKTLKNMASTRRIPSGKMGGKTIFYPRELDLWRDAGCGPDIAMAINNKREAEARKLAGVK